MAEETQIAEFESGDGVLHTVAVGSPAFNKMSKEGFKRLDVPAVEPDETEEPRMLGAGSGEPEQTPIAELKRPELIAKAKELGIEFKANIKNVDLIAEIEAKLEEQVAETEDGEPTE